MKKPFFTGVCTALITPFLQNQINYPMLQILLQRQMDAGIRSVVLCGTTGESPTLSDDEKLELIYRCKEYAGNRCKIIARGDYIFICHDCTAVPNFVIAGFECAVLFCLALANADVADNELCRTLTAKLVNVHSCKNINFVTRINFRILGGTGEIHGCERGGGVC